MNNNNKQELSQNYKKLLKTINARGLTFAIWKKTNADDKGSETYDWTSLVGVDKKKMIKPLPEKLEQLDILFLESKDTVIKLWKDFDSLYNFNQRMSPKKGDFYLYYMVIFIIITLGGIGIGYEKQESHPIHACTVYHVPISIKQHKNFKQFTGQGTEKTNDDAKRIYFRKSNKWDVAKSFPCSFGIPTKSFET